MTTGRRRTGIVGVLAAAALALAACGSLPPPAEPVAAVDCFSDAPAGSVPDGFVPRAVYVCDEHGGFEDAEGRWSARTIERREGDLAPLLDALAEPSDPDWPGPCSAVMVIVPELWLEGEDGTAIRVAQPRDGCRLPKGDRVGDALAGLTVVGEERRDARLLERSDAIAAGCPTWDETLRLPAGARLDRDGAPTTTPEGMALVPYDPFPDGSLVAGMRVCRYADAVVDVPVSGDVGLPTSGAFAGTGRLGRDAALAILAESDAEGSPPTACDAPARAFALLFAIDAADANVGLPIVVERDGCARLSTRGGLARASGATLALVGP